MEHQTKDERVARDSLRGRYTIDPDAAARAIVTVTTRWRDAILTGLLGGAALFGLLRLVGPPFTAIEVVFPMLIAGILAYRVRLRAFRQARVLLSRMAVEGGSVEAVFTLGGMATTSRTASRSLSWSAFSSFTVVRGYVLLQEIGDGYLILPGDAGLESFLTRVLPLREGSGLRRTHPRAEAAVLRHTACSPASFLELDDARIVHGEYEAEPARAARAIVAATVAWWPCLLVGLAASGILLVLSQLSSAGVDPVRFWLAAALAAACAVGLR